VTASANAFEDSKPNPGSTARSSEKPEAQPPERTATSVYAAYWQERSGFFSAESELPQRPSTR
jgi:hypothetical protein